MTDRSPLDAAALRAAVGPRWGRVDVVAETASTNADLLADTAAPDGTVLVAEHQSAGRGRLERSWTSPPRAGLTFSVLLRPRVPVARWGWLPLLTGLALHDAVAGTGVRVALKWPNDVLAAPAAPGAGERFGKLAGVLAQTSGDAVVVGIGLNVSTTAEELPVPDATSLLLCGAGPVDRSPLLTQILRSLDARYAQWTDAAGDAEACGLAPDYRRACTTLGQQVTVTAPDRQIRGRAVGLDASGQLTVDVDGARLTVGSGDVTHVRPG